MLEREHSKREMALVLVESPIAGDVETHIKFAGPFDGLPPY